MTTSRPVSRTKNAAARRGLVIAEAAALFDSQGYHQTRMEDIANRVGIAKPTLYHYFASKEEILFWIHEEFVNLLIARHRSRADLGIKPEQELLEVIGDILDLMETHRSHVRVFFEHYRELPMQYQSTIREKRKIYETLVKDAVDAGVRSGGFRDVDVDLATLALFGMCNWAYQWYRSEGRYRTREIAFRFWNIFMQGIGNPQTDLGGTSALSGERSAS